ncbi:DUF4402 domain-containing protein [Fusobacterium sp. SYSU M8D902]|uniref:DUF4402 domain-containing protein n=1 Tax=Fusobacterium sp. SYSU M8D902 TaxID=3159562 RepID=UPI0032E46A97
MKKYLLILMSFFMVILGITSFSNVENEKVPNELIINNPKKEVTTIESLKNREHGEMNISVTKINPIPITGIERDGKLEFELPEKVELEENIFVTDDVNKIQEHRTLKLNKNLTTFSLENQTEKTKLKVDKPSDSKKIYIAVKEQDKIKRVYENNYMNYDSTDIGNAYIYLDGRVHFGNLYNSNFNKISQGELFIGKNGKGNGFDLTIPLKNTVQITRDTYGTVEETSFYISSLEQTSRSGDYFYNKNGNFGLILKKSNSLKYIAEGRDVISNDFFDVVPAIKIPQNYYGGFDKFQEFRVGARHTDTRNYHYRTVIKHAGDDIRTFTAHENIDMTKVLVGNTVNINGKFDRRERNFLTCLYTQVDSIPIYENKHANVIASVMTVEENNRKVGDSGVVGPSIYPKFKVTVADEYEFNYYHEWDSAYGDRLNFTIKKLRENVGNKRYTIKVYSGRDYHVLLGVLNLNITNGIGDGGGTSPDSGNSGGTNIPEYDLGYAEFQNDSRISKYWIFGDGYAIKNNENKRLNFRRVAHITQGFFRNDLIKNEEITNIIVNGQTSTEEKWMNGKKYRIFSLNEGNKIAIPIGNNSGNFIDNMAIYINNIKNENYKAKINIKLIGNKAKYNGMINLTFVGKAAQVRYGNLDLSKYPISETNALNFDKLFNSEDYSGDKFFPFSSVVGKGSGGTGEYGTLITTLEVKTNTYENERVIKQDPFGTVRVELKNNAIEIVNNNWGEGTINIYKKNMSSESIRYIVKGYFYDNYLGEMNLNITNQKNSFKDIGNKKFTIDHRILNRWIYGNLLSSQEFNNSNKKDYSDLIKVNNFNIDRLSSSSVQVVDAIVNGNSSIGHENGINGYKYKIFLTSFGKVAIPIDINISNFNEKIAIYIPNNIHIGNYSASIKLIGSDGKIYRGDVKVESIGEVAKNTTAKVDLSKWSINGLGIWNDPENITTTGQDVTLENGKLFYWKTYIKSNLFNKNIITKLKVTKDGNEVKEVSVNNIGVKIECTEFLDNNIGFDNNGFFIKKKTENIKPIEYKIEGYYKDIFLGQTTLTITNQKNSFELTGDNTLDFGNMVYTSNLNEYRKEKLFKVKNPSNANLKFSVASSTGTIKNGMDNLKLENIKISESKNNGNGESSFLLGASAKVEKNTKPGQYTGEIQVIVDIDGTGK